MRSRIFVMTLLAASTAAVVACSATWVRPGAMPSPAVEPRTPTLVDEDAVYRAVLTRVAAGYYLEGDTLYVAREVPALFTSQGEARAKATEWWTRRLTPISDEWHLAWMIAKVQPRRVALPAELSGLPVVVTDSLAPRRSHYNWSYVRRLSRVGFNARGDSAIVLIDDVCRNMCGGMTMALAVRDARGWRAASDLWSAAR